jgi:hypothetical protein
MGRIKENGMGMDKPLIYPRVVFRPWFLRVAGTAAKQNK